MGACSSTRVQGVWPAVRILTEVAVVLKNRALDRLETPDLSLCHQLCDLAQVTRSLRDRHIWQIT